MRNLLIFIALAYLRFFARISLSLHQPLIIGIAGSVGKSSARNAISAIIKDHYSIKTVGNSETGIPLGILGIIPTSYGTVSWLILLLRAPFGILYLKNTKYLIAEMGIDDPYPPKNMSYLLTILKPHIAILLHESAAHTMQFEKVLTKEEKKLPDLDRLNTLITKIATEDAKIIRHAKKVIYNADNIYITREVEKVSKDKRISFGKNKDNTVSYASYDVSLRRTTFDYLWKNGEKKEKLTLIFNNYLLPKEYQSVFAASIATSISIGISLGDIKQSLEKNYVLPKGRSSLFHGRNNTIIIDSSYNASKDSILAFISLVSKLKQETTRETVFVFGDMRELGEEARIEHEEVAESLFGIVDYLYLVGPLVREYVLPVVQKNEENFKEIRWFDKSVRVGEFLKDQGMPKNSIVLFKGSQNTIYLEEAVKMVLENKEDKKKLCRQDDFWLQTKAKFFRAATF